MAAPGGKVVRRRKGTIASRYLEAIQCAGSTTTTTSYNNSFRSTPIAKRTTTTTTTNVTDTARKAADCAGSIFTASTAMMINPSDSISTSNTTSPARRRRGRSRTPAEGGTNSAGNSRSRSRSRSKEEQQQERERELDRAALYTEEYVHIPGSRSTAPLSGANKTPSPITPYSTKSIMGIDSEETDNSSEDNNDVTKDTQQHLDYAVATTASSIDCSEESSLNYLSVQFDDDDDDETDTKETPKEPKSENNIHAKQNPRSASESPGPQPKSPGQFRSRWELQQALGTPKRLQQPTSSEAGAPTEIMKNSLRSPYSLHRSPKRVSPSDILSRVRNRFQNDPPEQDEKNIPSLLDASQSFSVASSIEHQKQPKTLQQQQQRHERSKLARHVENARKQSLFAASVSDTTCTESVDTNQLSSLNGETGSEPRPLEAQTFRKLLPPQTDEQEEEKTPTRPGGLRRRPMGAQVAALAAHYRRGNGFARGVVQPPEEEDDDDEDENDVRKNNGQIIREDTTPSAIVPDPILSLSRTMEAASSPHNSHDEESTMPEYDSDENGFIAYNKRPKSKAVGVFQRKGSSHSKTDNDESSSQQQTRGRERERREIQPLFSSERLDESNQASIHESSIRSKSLGRTMTSKEFLRLTSGGNRSEFSRGDSPPPRRSKSLTNKKEASTSRDRQGVPGNIVVDNNNRGDEEDEELVHILRKSSERPQHDDDNEELSHDFESRPSSAPSVPKGKWKMPSSSSSTKSPARPASAMAFTSFKQGASVNRSSIKNKIRAYNLKKSPNSSTTTANPVSGSDGRYSVPNHGPKYLGRWSSTPPKGTQEEKKESDDLEDDASVTSLREKLEQRFRYYGEGDMDESIGSINDDNMSVQSLREQFEQRMRPNDDEADDSSVRNLRERFEPQPTRQTGAAVNSLRARFEPKPTRTPFAAMRQQGSSKIPTQVSRPLEREPEDVLKVGRQEPQENTTETTPVFKSMHSHLNEWSRRHQIERKSPVSNEKRERSNSFESTHSTEIQANISRGLRNRGWGNNMREMNVEMQRRKEEEDEDDTDDDSDDDTNTEGDTDTDEDEKRNIPGSHWASQNQNVNGLRRDDTKGSSTDSDFSDAVTLDPSFADVSVLSNPSAIRTLPSSDTDRNSDASSSILFEHLAKKVPEINDAMTKSNVKYHGNIDTKVSEQSDVPAVVTPDEPKKASNLAPYDHYLTSSPGDSTTRHWSMLYSNSSSRSTRTLDTPRLLSASSTRSSRSLDNNRKPHDSPVHSTWSSHHSHDKVQQEEDVSSTPLEVQMQSSRSVENPQREVEVSNRSSRSMDGNRQAYDMSSYRSTRSAEYPPRVSDASSRSTRSSDVSNTQGFQASQKHEIPSPSPIKGRYGASEPSRQLAHEPRTVLETPIPLQRQPAVPPMPSPFDENYAAIMESRHKMLLSRQRTLLSRRANREKQQSPGFFGRTNPLSATQGSTPHESSGSSQHSRVSNDTSLSSHSKRMVPKSYRTPNESKSKTVPTAQSKTSSVFSKIKRTLISPNSNKKESSQKQAVIDRISAIRAARLRRNHAYGELTVSEDPKQPRANLETIDRSGGSTAPTYRYWTHNDSLERNMMMRDDDMSFGTNESNAQEYAARLSID